MISRPLKLGFLASANGSSARAIIDAIRTGELEAEPRLVVSNNRTATVLTWAQLAGVPTACIPTLNDPQAADARLADEMTARGVELIVMSGYLRRLGPQTLGRFAGRVLNIHPGPLPDFGGEGMYGRRVHEAVVAARASESAVSIHVVDEEYDHGPVIAALPVPLQPDDSPGDVEARVRALEPGFFVQTLQRIARGELQLP